MYYKILKGTPLHEKLARLHEKILAAKKEAAAVVKEVNGFSYCSNPDILAGGIFGISFYDEPPHGWYCINQGSTPSYYRPKNLSENRELLAKIKSLPTVSFEELNVLLNFIAGTAPFGKALKWVKCPIVVWGSETTVVNLRGFDGYHPVEGMIHIIKSEYNTLAAKNVEENAKYHTNSTPQFSPRATTDGMGNRMEQFPH